MTQDHIFLSGISVHAQDGALMHEAEVGQLFLIDLDLEISLALPSRTDRIADTVCYSELAQAAILVFKSRKFHLIERAAREVLNAIFDGFPTISAVKISIHKPHAPIPAIFNDIGVVLQRRRGVAPAA